MLLKCRNCRAALLQRLSHEFLPASFLKCSGEYFLCGLDRYRANSIDISEKKIPRAHTHRSNLDGDAKVHDLVAGRGILRVGTPTERWKIQIQNSVCVSQI